MPRISVTLGYKIASKTKKIDRLEIIVTYQSKKQLLGVPESPSSIGKEVVYQIVNKIK